MTTEEILELGLERDDKISVKVFSKQPWGEPSIEHSTVEVPKPQIIESMLGREVQGVFQRIDRAGENEYQRDMLWIQHAEKSEHGRHESTYYGFEPWMLEKIERMG